MSDTRPKLGKALREMLARIGDMGDKGLMQLQITANGRSEFNKMKKLVDMGYAEVCEIKLSRETVPGVRITDDGKRALS